MSVENFRKTGDKLVTTYHDWHGGHRLTAAHELEGALGELKTALSDFLATVRSCRPLEALAAKIGAIVSKLDSVIGDAVEVVEAVCSIDDIVVKARDLVDHWGNWERVGSDAGDVVCDLTDLFGEGCK